MRKLVLTLALATLLLPGLSFAETTAAPQPAPEYQAVLTFEEIFLASSCLTESALLSPPGCAKPCKTDLNCPYYPEQVCLSGCCVF
ncbi:MAG TPA: hypothetical protein VH394_12925 [Thermoanaerobaculia bacterium]|jgi:hypothetical protein|nr:hypothetical protein [Thermoanaerobaculia bacterium]